MTFFCYLLLFLFFLRLKPSKPPTAVASRPSNDDEFVEVPVCGNLRRVFVLTRCFLALTCCSVDSAGCFSGVMFTLVCSLTDSAGREIDGFVVLLIDSELLVLLFVSEVLSITSEWVEIEVDWLIELLIEASLSLNELLRLPLWLVEPCECLGVLEPELLLSE